MMHITDSYRRFFDRLFLVSLCVLAFGIPTSTVLMSVAQFGFGAAVFMVPDYRTKINRLLRNPFALFWIGLYVLFLAGGLASDDISYFLKDIRVKMPLWVIPAALALMPPLSERQWNLVLHFFVAGCLVASLAGLVMFSTGKVTDFRALSPMVSHIRLGIYLVFSLFILLYFSRKKSLLPRWVYLALGLFMGAWLFFLKSFTGIILFTVLFSLIIFIFFLSGRPRLRLAFGFFVGLGSVYLAVAVWHFYRVNEEPYASLPKYTREGNAYLHDTTLKSVENGNYIWRYLQLDELKRDWEKRSDLPFDGTDKKGNVLKATLCRYLASKNLPRDAEGIWTLSDKEIHLIENGIPNYLYARPFNLRGRIYETLWEWEVYRGTGDPNGKSLSARVELWKASVAAVVHSPWSGYGTGDVRTALKHALRGAESPLVYFGQFGPHNQFLATWMALGTCGFLWMLICIFSPLAYAENRKNWLSWVAVGILFLASLNEDIFETQASVTFFSFLFHLVHSRLIPSQEG